MVNISKVGDGKVVLLAGGGKCYTDIAARFCKSEKDLESIIGSEYDKNIVKRILDSNHLAATEFDYFIFGVEWYARVTETQLVRKRVASYLIKSGRPDKKGKRSYDVVMPEDIMGFNTTVEIPITNVYINSVRADYQLGLDTKIHANFDVISILELLEEWYNTGVALGKKEEELRYLKPQATEFKAIIGMNAHALIDWFKIRCCKNAQTEIKDMAMKMLKIVKQAQPDLFQYAGPSCVSLGYCPESNQNADCVGKIIKKEEALRILRDYNKVRNEV